MAQGRPERRRFPRFQFPSVEVRCSRPGSLPFLSRRLEAQLLDASAAGLRLSTSEEIRSGETIRGAFTIPETRDSVRFAGRVRWVRKMPHERFERGSRTIFGLAFVDMDPGDQAKIESMRKWFTSDRYKSTRRAVRT